MQKQNKILFLCAAFAAFLLYAVPTTAQIRVLANGRAGFGTTNPAARLHVRTQTSGSNFFNGIYNEVIGTGNSGRNGMYNYSTSPSTADGHHRGFYNFTDIGAEERSYGIYNFTTSNNSGEFRYGMYNYLNCGSDPSYKYALYSSVSCGNGFAGYFNGNVFVSGTLTQISDKRKKTNIAGLTNALSLIGQLSPKTYDYLADDALALPDEHQFGFLAQDLEGVLPDLVRTVTVPGKPILDESGEKTEVIGETAATEVKSVNYMAMIPILVKAIQEQQAEIEAQKAELEALKQKLNGK